VFYYQWIRRQSANLGNGVTSSMAAKINEKAYSPGEGREGGRSGRREVEGSCPFIYRVFRKGTGKKQGKGPEEKK